MISNFRQTNHRLTTNEFLKSRKILIKPLIAGIQQHTERGIIEIIGLRKGLNKSSWNKFPMFSCPESSVLNL